VSQVIIPISDSENSDESDNGDEISPSQLAAKLADFRSSAMSQPRTKKGESTESYPRNVKRLSKQAKLRRKDVPQAKKRFISEQEAAWAAFQSASSSKSHAPLDTGRDAGALSGIVDPSLLIDASIKPIEKKVEDIVISGSTNLTNAYDSVGWDSDSLHSKAMEVRMMDRDALKHKDKARESKKSDADRDALFGDVSDTLDLAMIEDLNLVGSLPSVKIMRESGDASRSSSPASDDNGRSSSDLEDVLPEIDRKVQKVEAWSDTDFAVVDAGERPVYVYAETLTSDEGSEQERDFEIADLEGIYSESSGQIPTDANLEFSFGDITDRRSASFGLVDEYDGSTVTNLRYVRHQIYAGKAPMPDDLPAVYVTSKNDASTILVVLADAKTGLEVHLIYVAMHHFDVITRRVTYINVDSRPLCGVDYSSTRTAASSRDKTLYQEPHLPTLGSYSSHDSTHTTDGGSPNCYKVLHRANSLTLDLPASPDSWCMTSLADSGGVRCKAETSSLDVGIHKIDCCSEKEGNSAHRHSPFVAFSVGSLSENKGEVKGFALVYSGCFQLEAEVDAFNRMRINMGLDLSSGQWHLGRGEVFNTPEVIIGRSGDGMGGLSRTLHRLFRECVAPRFWGQFTNWPVILNTLETCIDVNHANVVQLATKAAEIGVDLLVVDVLDCGSFGQKEKEQEKCTAVGYENSINSLRNSQGQGGRAGGGSSSNRSPDTMIWSPDPEKLHGLNMLVRKVNSAGVKIGLSMKPETLFPCDSAFVKTNPGFWRSTCVSDMHVHAGGEENKDERRGEGEAPRGRMLLDLSNNLVADHAFTAISSLISSANFEYIFWDMEESLDALSSVCCCNRTSHNKDSASKFGEIVNAAPDDTDAADKGGDGSIFESETAHRYMLGMYSVLHRLIKTFPLVVIDSSFSRGGRFDPGMLSCCATIWAAGTHANPWKSMHNFYETSIVYPARSIGTLVNSAKSKKDGGGSDCQAHDRTCDLIFMLGSLGFQLDLNSISVESARHLRNQIRKYKRYMHITLLGDIYRLWNPATMPVCAIQFISKDQTEVLVLVLCSESKSWSKMKLCRLCLDGLVPHAKYKVTEPYPTTMATDSSSATSCKPDIKVQPVYQLGDPMVVLNGDTLMNAGLPLKFYSPDDSKIFYMKRIVAEQ